MIGFIVLFVIAAAMAGRNNHSHSDREHLKAVVAEVMNQILKEKGLNNFVDKASLWDTIIQQGLEIQLSKQVMVKLHDQIQNFKEEIEVLHADHDDMNRIIGEHRQETEKIIQKVAEMEKQLDHYNKYTLFIENKLKRMEEKFIIHESKSKRRDKCSSKKMFLKFNQEPHPKCPSHKINTLFAQAYHGQKETNYVQSRSTFRMVNDKTKEKHVETLTSGGWHQIQLQHRTAVGTGIAFSAYANHLLPHLTAGHIIKCDQVLLNDGNNYNSVTGVFTVPENGVYLFTFTIATDLLAHWVVIKLVVDNRETTEAATDPQYDTHVEMASNTVILRLSQGESVWLEVAKSNDAHLWTGPHTTTFSGVLLYA